jgi:superfamily I DNA/RNA helicase
VRPFNAVLVDEGQDFNEPMLKVLMALLGPNGELTLTLDSYQDLYRRRPSWESLGIKASGRTFHLKRVYRHTEELFRFTQRFIGKAPKNVEARKKRKQMVLIPDDSVAQGEPPELRQFQNAEELEAFLLDDLKRSIDREGYSASETAIIYDDKIYGPSRFSIGPGRFIDLSQFAYDNRALPMRILKKLEMSHIPVVWVSQDVRSKEAYDIITEKTSLISIHSSKGLEFELVYFVGVDQMRPTEHTLDVLVSLIYVALTRATYRLVVPYVEETELIKKMKKCLPKR